MWRIFLWIWVLWVPQALAFEDSTSGTEEGGSTGGFKADDDATLDKETQNMIRKFRAGRASSGAKGGEKSRVSSIFEMHDSNLDGISDHANSNNDLEGGQEEAAIGRRGLGQAEREKLLAEKEKQAVEACFKRARVDGRRPDDPTEGSKYDRKRLNCQNAYISPNIVDKGSAHGDNSPHRIYELSEESQRQAEATGQRYGQRVIQDIKDAQGRHDSGKEQEANIDLLRSEAAWLEDQKQMSLRQGWKFLRAQRLSSKNNSATLSRGEQEILGEEIQAIYRQVPSGDSGAIEKADQRAAQLIAERDAALSSLVCLADCQRVPRSPGACKEASDALLKAAGRTDTNKAVGLPLGACLAAQRLVQPGFQARSAVEQARRNLSAADKRAAQSQVATIKKCLGQDVWCKASDAEDDRAWREKNRGKPESEAPRFTEVKGDPGNAFTDSRELIYHQADKASRGPLNQYMKTMNTADFKPGMKMYDQLEKDVKDAKTRVDAFRKSEEKDPNKRFIRNGNWDSSRQSVNQMSQSARDVERSLGTRTTGAYRARQGDNEARRPASRPPMGAIGSPNTPGAQPSAPRNVPR